MIRVTSAPVPTQVGISDSKKLLYLQLRARKDFGSHLVLAASHLNWPKPTIAGEHRCTRSRNCLHESLIRGLSPPERRDAASMNTRRAPWRASCQSRLVQR